MSMYTEITCWNGHKWPPQPVYHCNVSELRELRMKREAEYWENGGDMPPKTQWHIYLENEIARGVTKRVSGYKYEECEHAGIRPCE